ncbi:MAG: NUDIX hydrolase [Nitrospirales bacterium]|jgi:ADP-ribose pyrophosphatase|nr:MAG: NUDIX hydrolase [Nitrospirales bacterium]
MQEETLLSTKRMYTGKVLKLDLDTVALPNGRTTELEILRHPGASAVVPLKEDGRVVLIRQLRHAAGGFIYEIPAGKLDPQEDPRDCAARELEEEIGYCAGHLELLTSIWTAPGFTDEVIHIYLGTHLEVGKQNLDQDEVLEIVEWPLEVAMAKILDGTIRDAKTIIGLQMVYGKKT